MAKAKETVKKVEEVVEEVKNEATVEAEEVVEVKEEVKTVAAQKAEAVIDYIKAQNINGIRYIEVDENNKIFESRFMIEGQALPLFVVVNSTVYSYIHVHLVTITPEKAAKCNTYLNELNDKFPMLKYFINNVGNVVLTCSVPAADDKFDAGLMFALVDQVKGLLEANYSELMKKIWED